MKKRFTEEPVLLMTDQSKPFQIESDASKVATGAVLTQLAQYLLNWIQMATNIPLHSCQRLSLKPKESTKSMIENY
jgi:RNase H-like domain found in reverse transcriptase